MKERRSIFSIPIANEPLIEEYKTLFGKISDFKGSKYLVVEKLKSFRKALHEYQRQPLKLLKESWDDNPVGIESEILDYFKFTFKSDYLYNEFSKNIPEKIAAASNVEFNQVINRPDLNFFQFLAAALDLQGLKNLKIAQLNFLDKVIDCLNVGGLLEQEIDKRDKNLYSRYHLQISIQKEGNRKKNIREFFLKRSEVDSIFTTFQKQGVALVFGKMVQFHQIKEVKIGKTLIKKEEEGLYRSKHFIINDVKFFSTIPDATKEFYNNEFLERMKTLPQVNSIATSINDKLHTIKDMKIERLDIVAKIRDNIREDNVKIALQYLDEFIQKIEDKSLYNNFILLSSQFNSEEKKFNRGLGRDTGERNRIIAAIIDLTNDAEQIAKNNL